MQITIEDIEERGRKTIKQILFDTEDYFTTEFKLYGVPRGGMFCALVLMNLLPKATLVSRPEDATHIIDDIYDSGKTMERYQKLYPDDIEFICFYNSKEFQNEWVVFPWEVKDKTAGVGDVIERVIQLSGAKTDTQKDYLDTAITMAISKIKEGVIL